MKKDLILSLQAYSLRHKTFMETLQIAAKLGFRCLESYPGQKLGGGLPGTTDYNSMSADTRAKLKQRLSVQPVKVVSYGVTGAGNDAQWTKLMEFCKDLGIEIVQIEAAQSKEYYDRAEKFAKQYGIKVALHNHTQPKGQPQPMLETLKGRSEWIGAGADIGHWARTGIDAADGVALLKEKFNTFHLADVAPKSCGYRDLPLGAGIIDVKRALDTLAAQGRKIYATIEYEASTATLESDIAACVRYFRAWQRDEITNDNKVGVKSVGAIWRDIKTSALPDTWTIPVVDKESAKCVERTKQMKRMEVDLASVKANKPGANPGEAPEMAFSDDKDRKYCQVDWPGRAFVSCALKQAGTAKIYTVSSSNDASGRDPAEWKLWGSNDGTKWFELDHRKDQFFPGRYFLEGFEIKQPQACKYLKFEVLANGGDSAVQFSRLGFYE